jgi:hypothetical protein
MGWKLIKRANAIAYLDNERKRQEEVFYNTNSTSAELQTDSPEEEMVLAEEEFSPAAARTETYSVPTEGEMESGEPKPIKTIKEKKSVKKTNKKKKAS